MPIVNRLLDAFFRTLDAVDMARERLDRALGRAPRPEPWTTDWSPTPEPPAAAPARIAPAPRPKAPATAKRTAPHKPAAKASRAPQKAQKAAPKAGKPGRKPGGGKRKGSVDRKGVDIDSARAKATLEKLKEQGLGVVSDDADVGGKRVLARVLWALDAADRAGSELGLTAVDASALLHLAAGMEVYATNVARTCRDEGTLIEESAPDGRSKRYKLTAAGRKAAAQIATRAI